MAYDGGGAEAAIESCAACRLDWSAPAPRENVADGTLCVGTSGFSYAHWRGLFYPPSLDRRDWLRHYATVFDAVELNVTFYRTPRPATFERWASIVPDGFCFVVKGPRFVTHLRRLAVDADSVARFSASVRPLGEKLRCVLWQLAPSHARDTAVLARFLDLLGTDPVLGGTRHAFEFRHASWFADEVDALLEAHAATAVFADSGGRYPSSLRERGGFSYLRFHGPGALYASRYEDDELERYAALVRRLFDRGDVFAFFNNDAMGYAIENALRLRELALR